MLQWSAPIRLTVQTGSPSRTTVTPSSWSPLGGTSLTMGWFTVPAKNYVRILQHWTHFVMWRFACETSYNRLLLITVMHLCFRCRCRHPNHPKRRGERVYQAAAHTVSELGPVCLAGTVQRWQRFVFYYFYCKLLFSASVVTTCR